MLVWLVTLDHVVSDQAADMPAQHAKIGVAALLLLLVLGLAGVIPHVLSYVWPSDALNESERRLRLTAKSGSARCSRSTTKPANAARWACSASRSMRKCWSMPSRARSRSDTRSRTV